MTLPPLCVNIHSRSINFSMKKWSKLVLATMLSVGTLLVSGCIESIEPEGIADLRGAKVELLNAQAALQMAQAAKAEADAALVLAEAKIKEAIAKQEEAKVKFIEAQTLEAEYAAEYQKLLNEREAIINAGLEAGNAAAAEAARIENEKALAELERYIAETQQMKADAEREAQIAAAELAAELLELQVRLVEAQGAYEVALKELAAAKVTLSPLQKAYVASAEAEVLNWELEVANYTTQLEYAAEDLEAAVAQFDEDTALAVKLAESAVLDAEAELAAAMEAAEIAKIALEIDPNVADWAAERQKLQDQLAEMKLERDLARIEREKANADLIAAKTELQTKAYEYAEATGFGFNEVTGEFSIKPVTSDRTYLWVPETYVAAPVTEDGFKPFGEDFYIAPNGIYFKYDDKEYALNLFETRVESLSYLTEDYYDSMIETKKEIMAGIEEDNQADLDEYAAAVAAYSSKDILAYYKEYVNEDYDIAGPVAEFNAALADAVAKINTYNEEYIKRLPEDVTEAKEAVIAEYLKEEAEAKAIRLKARQDALDKYNAEEVKYKNANLAHQRALRSYNAVIDAALIATGKSTVAEIELAIDEYKAAKAAAEAADLEFDTDGTLTAAYNTNLAELKKIEVAQKAYDDPLNDKDDAFAIWKAAEKAWTDAYTAYTKACSDADALYNKTIAASEQKRDDALDDLNVGASQIYDYDYIDHLLDEANNANDVMMSALNAVKNVAVVDFETVYDVVFGNKEEVYWILLNLPSFAYDEEKEAIKEIKVEDVLDPEYFLETVVTGLAENLVNFEVYAYAAGNDGNGNSTSYGSNYSYAYEFDEAPLTLPTKEEYSEFVDASIEDAYNEVISELYYLGYGNIEWHYEYLSYASDYTRIYNVQNQIAEIETSKSYLALLPDFITALEKAKAEFEAYAESEVARIDALRDEVETGWLDVVDELDAMAAEETAYNAEVTEINQVVNILSALIEEYIGTQDVESLVAGLEDAYEAALVTVDDAETALEEAKAELEKAKAGDATGVEIAQKNYDKIAAKLAAAITELEAAAAALEAAIAEVTPVTE